MAPSNPRRSPAPWRRRRLPAIAVLTGLPLLLGSLYLAGDSLRIDSPGKKTQERQLAGSKDSVEALARLFLQALAEGDPRKLAAFGLSRREFERFVYPKLPAARPEANASTEFVWAQTHLRSQAGLSRTLARHGGRKYQLLGYAFAGGQKEYDGFTICKDTRLLVRDEDGKPLELDLFGSIIEMNGEFKIYSLAVD